jgi:hypothetical protein
MLRTASEVPRVIFDVPLGDDEEGDDLAEI